MGHALRGFGFDALKPADNGIEERHEKQSRHRADDDAAKHGARQHRVLLLSRPPIAIGIMPTIIAAAVIRTGRNRVVPADSAASKALIPASRCSLAKVTSRIEFAEATPIAMISPSARARSRSCR